MLIICYKYTKRNKREIKQKKFRVKRLETNKVKRRACIWTFKMKLVPLSYLTKWEKYWAIFNAFTTTQVTSALPILKAPKTSMQSSYIVNASPFIAFVKTSLYSLLWWKTPLHATRVNLKTFKNVLTGLQSHNSFLS